MAEQSLGSTTVTQVAIIYAYVDASAQLGTIVELLEND